MPINFQTDIYDKLILDPTTALAQDQLDSLKTLLQAETAVELSRMIDESPLYDDSPINDEQFQFQLFQQAVFLALAYRAFTPSSLSVDNFSTLILEEADYAAWKRLSGLEGLPEDIHLDNENGFITTLKGQLARKFYLDALKQYVNETPFSDTHQAQLKALFQLDELAAIEETMPIGRLFSGLSTFTHRLFTEENIEAYQDQLADIQRLALDQFYERHCEQVDLTDALTRDVLKGFASAVESLSPQDLMREVGLQVDSHKSILFGEGVDPAVLSQESIKRLAANYKQQLDDHQKLVEEHGDFEQDADFLQHIQLADAITREILGTGVSPFLSTEALGADAPGSDKEIVRHYHQLVELMAQRVAGLTDVALSDEVDEHQAVVDFASRAADDLDQLIDLLNQRIDTLSGDRPDQSRDKARLLTVIEGLKGYQQFMVRFAGYHRVMAEAIRKTLDEPRTDGDVAPTDINRDLNFDVDHTIGQVIDQVLADAKSAYAQAVFRQHNDWEDLLSRVRGMHHGRIDITVRDVNVVPKTADAFKEIFESQRDHLKEQGITLSRAKTKSEAGASVTSYEITLPDEEEVILEHHVFPPAKNKEPELKATSTSSHSLARVLALMYKVDLQKAGKLDAEGKPVAGFTFNLSDDQIELSHNSVKPDAAPEDVTSDEREQFLTELDTAFRETFGKAYTGRVATRVIEAKLKTRGMWYDTARTGARGRADTASGSDRQEASTEGGPTALSP